MRSSFTIKSVVLNWCLKRRESILRKPNTTAEATANTKTVPNKLKSKMALKIFMQNTQEIFLFRLMYDSGESTRPFERNFKKA